MLSASRSDSGPPRRLMLAVALIASATLIEEILVTRLSSVLFYYHFSFFSIALVMSGLVIGGLIAARRTAREPTDAVFLERLAWFANLFAACVLMAMLVVRLFPGGGAPPSVPLVIVYSLIFLPGLVAAGTFLALAFSRRERWIDHLYGSDLFGAAVGCVASIFALRTLGGLGAFGIPAVLSAVAAALLTASPNKRSAPISVAVGVSALLVIHLFRPIIRLRDDANPPMFERWNEHSRVIATDVGGLARYLVIDRTAGTLMRRIPPKPGGQPVDIDPAWNKGSQYAAYHAGRRVRRAAIMGVGGGFDLLAALASGAKEVHGYELNRTFVDLLERDFKDFNAITSRPELRLFHTEARVGIAHSEKRYDIIQASLIDTWAATASGGFVLSENNLYTREAWRTFLDHLTHTGILTMTRWYIPSAPAETLRLVSLAATALDDAGYRNAADHLVLMRSTGGDSSGTTGSEVAGYATILVSKTPFDSTELASLRKWGAPVHTDIVAARDAIPEDPDLRGLLAEATRADTIRRNRFDITPPGDEKPYFFLQVRPRDFASLFHRTFGEVTEITFNGIRVLLILCASALAFVAAIAAIALRSSTSTSPEHLPTYRRMILYFLGIGAGYIAVQLGLHQRLIVALGHPTLALTVVLFGMLLGTGLGASVSSKIVRSGRPFHAVLAIVGVLVPVLALGNFASYLERIDSSTLRITAAGTTVALVGAVLGLAFPVGVRNISPLGDKAVQHAWAMNGAASIAASALSALVGVTWGSTGVLAFGGLLYVAAAAAVWPIGKSIRS
jgi:hypothetical protein